MYKIRQASIRSGVNVPLIRAWERRYGVVSPSRTAAGYRLYDDEAIATLARVRELTETGWSASEASRAVLAGEVSVGPAPALRRDRQESGIATRRAELIDRFLAAAMDMDVRATGAGLDEMFAVGSFESIVDDLIMPALVQLGDAWGDGRLDVAAEHAASAAVYRRLAALYDAAGAPGDIHVVVGLPPGAHHEIGALAFAVALRRLGTGVLYVGADVPVSSWMRVVAERRPRVAVVAVVQEADRASALEVARALRDAPSAPTVALGGRFAAGDGSGEDAALTVLPERIVDAAAEVARLVGR
jgi:DNA-binding transcriptional MerR regulator/methylmalonyl-CoA mutase cobalamin-binding subunit